jgi:hypothetical protein
VIIEDLLHLDIAESEEIPDDIQHTKERKPDALKKVTDSQGNTFIVHLEFQVKDEADMVYRMAEYKVMLLRRYKIPVKQSVIFLAAKRPNMPTRINTEKLKYNYDLIRLCEIDYRIFLNSKNPEVKMLGILANLGKYNVQQAIQNIVDGISTSTESDLEKYKYYKQFRIFVQLRKSIQPLLEKVMESVSTFFKEENDIFYRKGEIKGEEKKSHTVVENLIEEFGFSDEQAAQAAEVSIEYVKKIRSRLEHKK